MILLDLMSHFTDSVADEMVEEIGRHLIQLATYLRSVTVKRLDVRQSIIST